MIQKQKDALKQKENEIINKGISDAMTNYYGPRMSHTVESNKKNWVKVVDTDTFIQKLKHR